MYFDKKDIENHGRLFNLIFIGEGKTKYDELERDEIFDDFKRMYYDIKEEFSVADLDKFATDDSYDDPFNVDFDCESGECEKEQEQQDELGKKVPEIADFSGSVELGHEPDTAVNVSRSSSSFGGRKESTVDINVQCEDDEESITDALKELICSLGLEDEFELDSCCDGEKCPEEPVAEPAVEPEEQAAEPEEVKDLSDEDEVKVKMPAEVADGVNDGDMLVVKVDNKDEEEKEGNLDEGFLGIKSSDEKNGDILEKAGAKCYIIRTSPRSGNSSQKAKDPANPDKEIQDRTEIRWTDAVKYAKQHSKGSVVIYVKASKAKQTQPDYTIADNFGKSGYLFVDGRMTAQSEQRLKNFLVDLKNTDVTSTGNEEKANHEKVIDLIKAIGEVKLDEESSNKIKKAREAYDYLSGDEKKYVTNYSDLEKAENDYKALEQQNKENKQKQEEDEAGKFKQSIKDKLSSDAYKEGDEWSFRLYCPSLGKLPVGEVKAFKSSDEAVNGIIKLVEIAKKLPFETKIKLSKQKKSDGANASVFMNIGEDHNVTLAESVIKSAEEDDDMSEEEFLEELGKELKNSRECKEAWNAHDNFVNPGVLDESPELEGTDNAVKECKPYKLVAHCKEENIDCEMKKPALEKPLLEDINNVFDLFEAKDMKDDELPVDPEAAKLEVHTMLNDLVADEIEAINGYDDAKAEIMDTPIEHKDNILDTIDHIKEEEQEHIDELIGATTEIPFEKEEAHEEEYAVKSLAEALNEDKLQAIEKYLKSSKVAYLTTE